jgi:hypothetical protein
LQRATARAKARLFHKAALLGITILPDLAAAKQERFQST